MWTRIERLLLVEFVQGCDGHSVLQRRSFSMQCGTRNLQLQGGCCSVTLVSDVAQWVGQ